MVRDAEALEPIVGVCAFASAMLAARGGVDKEASLLVLCAPNAILAWVQTLQTYGVSGLESARGRDAERKGVDSSQERRRVRPGDVARHV